MQVSALFANILHIMSVRINTEDAKSLGERLRVARQSIYGTLKSAERATGVNHGQISRIERGDFCTVSPNVQLLCNNLQVPLTPPHSTVSVAALSQKMTDIVGQFPSRLRFIDRMLDALKDQLDDRA